MADGLDHLRSRTCKVTRVCTPAPLCHPVPGLGGWTGSGLCVLLSDGLDSATALVAADADCTVRHFARSGSWQPGRLRSKIDFSSGCRTMFLAVDRSMARKSAFTVFSLLLPLCLFHLGTADEPGSVPAATPQQVERTVERAIRYLQTESADWLKRANARLAIMCRCRSGH